MEGKRKLGEYAEEKSKVEREQEEKEKEGVRSVRRKVKETGAKDENWEENLVEEKKFEGQKKKGRKGERRKKRKKVGKRGQGWGAGGLEEMDKGERERKREIKKCGEK